jgi:hypothetical protein
MGWLKPATRELDYVLISDSEHRPLREALLDTWGAAAANAWEGYQAQGRGYVVIQINKHRVWFTPTETEHFRSLTDDDHRMLRRLCSQYNPAREIVIMTWGFRKKRPWRELHTEVFLAIMATPPGMHDPPIEFETKQQIDAVGEFLTARHQQSEQLHALQREGLDPNEEPFVNTDTGWQRLRFVLDENWVGLAAAAWRGYQQSGRGAVVANFASYDFRFVAVDAVRGDDARQEDPWPEVLRYIQQYNPQREVVLVTTATQDGRDMHLSLHISLLQTPRGGMSPPEAAAAVYG